MASVFSAGVTRRGLLRAAVAAVTATALGASRLKDRYFDRYADTY